MILDPDMLLAHCAFISCEVIERQFATESSRHDAAEEILRDLGFCMERFRMGGWVAVTIQQVSMLDEIHLYGDHADFDRASEVDFESRQVVVGANLNACEIGAIAIALDDCADIWLDEPRVHQLYSNEMLDKAFALVAAIEAYIDQWLWFGDVPQTHPYWNYALEIAHGSRIQWVNPFE